MKYKKMYWMLMTAVISFAPLYIVVAQKSGFVASAKTAKVSESKMQASSLTNLKLTVSQLSTIRNKNYVILEGAIIQQVKGEHYRFQDATGTVDVDIDRSLWHGKTVDPNTRVRLLGEVEHKHNGQVEVDVVQLELVK